MKFKSIALLLLLCIGVVGCSKTNEVNETNTESVSVSDSSIDVEPESSESFEEVLNELPIEDIVEVEVDGEVYTSPESLMEAVTPEETDEPQVEHIPVEGGSNKSVSILDNTNFEEKYIPDGMEYYEKDNEANQMIIHSDVEECNKLLDQFAEDGVLDNNDLAMLRSFRSVTASIISDIDDNMLVNVRYPNVPSGSIYVEVYDQDLNPRVLHGTHEDLYLYKSFNNAVWRGFYFEYKDLVYGMSKPISKDLFESEYKDYCSYIGDTSNKYYCLLNNIDGCSGSLTMFIKTANDYYIPVVLGSKTQKLSEDTQLEFLVSYMSNTVFADNVSTMDSVIYSWHMH